MNLENILDLKTIIKYRKEDELKKQKIMLISIKINV